jgi:DNA-binding transcriptional MocR family regulator
MQSEQAFLWLQRLQQERAMRNITDTHVRIAQFTMGAIEAGDDQMSHAAVATALGYGARTVRDAYRRLRGLGLLDWQAQARGSGDHPNWRTTNRYWLRMPDATPEPRPDLRRHAAVKPLANLLPTSAAHCAYPAAALRGPLLGFAARFAAKLAAEKATRLARNGRLSGQ